MTREDASDAIKAAFRELHETLARIEDPATRRDALLLSYAKCAVTHAETFAGDLFITAGSKPHRDATDLQRHANVVLGDFIEVCLKANASFGLDFPSFRAVTEQIVESAFFSHLNDLIARQPARGSA